MRIRATVPASLALLCGAQLACAHEPPKHQTFHYRSAATEGRLDEQWRTSLDFADSAHWADGLHLRLPHPGVLRVSTQTFPDGPVSVLLYSNGKKPLAQVRAPAPLVSPRVEGEVFVVLRVDRSKGPVAVRLTASFEPEAGSAAPPPVPLGAGTHDPPQLNPPAADQAKAPSPDLGQIKDLELDGLE